jgi:secreted trypsin-like serine protease
VSSFVSHPSYSSSTYNYDAAVITLSSAIPSSTGYQALPLSTNSNPGGSVAFVGYGQTQNGANSQLNYATGSLYSRTSCRSALAQFNYVTDQMICSSPSTSSSQATTICSGDSGGPWVHSGAVAGITSWGIAGQTSGCYCYGNYPAVACNVGAIRSWIEGQM